MRGAPICNDALRVEAVGFLNFVGYVLGIVVTPRVFLNLIVAEWPWGLANLLFLQTPCGCAFLIFCHFRSKRARGLRVARLLFVVLADVGISRSASCAGCGDGRAGRAVRSAYALCACKARGHRAKSWTWCARLIGLCGPPRRRGGRAMNASAPASARWGPGACPSWRK